MSEGKNTQIAAVETGFTALANNNILEEALADEYAGLEFSIDRVKLPAGGGTAFEVPAEDGEDTEMVKDITGVILYNHPAFAYYASAFAGGHAAPDCSSIDGVTGVGTPGGDCRTCPYNKFGSGDGQSKLCKNKRMLYILREGERSAVPADGEPQDLHQLREAPAHEGKKDLPDRDEDFLKESDQRGGHCLFAGGIHLRARAVAGGDRGGIRCGGELQGVCRQPVSGGILR